MAINATYTTPGDAIQPSVTEQGVRHAALPQRLRQRAGRQPAVPSLLLQHRRQQREHHKMWAGQAATAGVEPTGTRLANPIGLASATSRASAARGGRDPGEHYQQLTAAYGSPRYTRIDAPVTATQKAAFKRLTGDAVTATELAVSDPTNAGPATVKATGRVCYASANRAVTALEHLTRYARFRGV